MGRAGGTGSVVLAVLCAGAAGLLLAPQALGTAAAPHPAFVAPFALYLAPGYRPFTSNDTQVGAGAALTLTTPLAFHNRTGKVDFAANLSANAGSGCPPRHCQRSGYYRADETVTFAPFSVGRSGAEIVSGHWRLAGTVNLTASGKEVARKTGAFASISLSWMLCDLTSGFCWSSTAYIYTVGFASSQSVPSIGATFDRNATVPDLEPLVTGDSYVVGLTVQITLEAYATAAASSASAALDLSGGPAPTVLHSITVRPG